jgi:hypothetical protein
MKGKIVTTLAAGIFMFGVIGGARVYWSLREPLRAKTTTTNMIFLMGVLDSDQPEKVDSESIRSLLARGKRSYWLKDDWGRPFVIERKEENGQPRYTIISLGRDGRRGSCCQKWVDNWDDDAVLSGKEWLQVWYPKAVRQRTAPAGRRGSPHPECPARTSAVGTQGSSPRRKRWGLRRSGAAAESLCAS